MKKDIKSRNNYIDIIKAIGIISIVIGHSSWLITKYDIRIAPFVYTYHLMIFMFISGYLFNTDKANENNNYKYIDFGKQLVKFSKMFFVYGLIFNFLHNIFLSFNIITGENYNISTIIKNSLNSLTFGISEELLCAFWFVPMLLIARILFLCTYSEKNISKWYRIIPIILFFAIVGIILCQKHILLNYRAHISFLSVPFIYLGIYAKRYWNKIEKIFAPWAWIISMIIIYSTVYLTNKNIDLSVANIMNPFLFYPISIVGIHFCLSLANMINKIKIVDNIFAKVGKNSFHIMAMHFLIIKIIDAVYCKINGINDINLISHFPNSFPKKLYLIYYILAVAIPTLIMMTINCIKFRFKERTK